MVWPPHHENAIEIGHGRRSGDHAVARTRDDGTNPNTSTFCLTEILNFAGVLLFLGLDTT
ncbi:MAG: hypothetical protein K1000chlam2_01672 [Chlamydiae bacterium]|nr:hypothetical protein [Chlamydiota bacterium]